jgi:hypothetical protein
MWKQGQEAQPSNTHLTPGYVRQNSHYILITIEYYRVLFNLFDASDKYGIHGNAWVQASNVIAPWAYFSANYETV